MPFSNNAYRAGFDHLSRVEERYRNDISKHWSSDFVFTDVWTDGNNVRELGKDELLPGELSAVAFTVGCYTVRSAQRVYRLLKDRRVHIPGDEAPANRLELAYIKGRYVIPGIAVLPFASNNLRVTHEITARHNTDPDKVFKGKFKYICRAAEDANHNWHENISCICTIKEEASLPDECASLFVLKQYIGDSFSADHWYVLNPSGEVTDFRIQPFDSE